jgi:hypothetical protein
LEEENFMGFGDLKQADQALFRGFLDSDELFASVRYLQDRSAAAWKAEHFVADAFEDWNWENSWAGGEVK